MIQATPSRADRPRLVEELGGNAFRGRLADGSPVRVLRTPAEPGTESALEELYRRLAQLRQPTLVPLLATWAESGAVWTSWEWLPGASLASLAGKYELTPGQVAQIGMGVLDGLATLQRASVVHGALSEDSVVIQPDGSVRVRDYGLQPRLRRRGPDLDIHTIAWPDPKIDLIAAGSVLAGLLGLEEGETDEDHAATPTALSLTVRSLAAGQLGRDASAARAAFADSAGMLVGPAAWERNARELGFFARSLASPVTSPGVRAAGSPYSAPPPPVLPPQPPPGGGPPTPPSFAPQAPSPVPTAAPATVLPRPRRRNWPLTVGLAAFGLFLLLAFASELGLIGRPAASRMASPRRVGRTPAIASHPSPAPSPAAPKAAATPVRAGTAANPVLPPAAATPTGAVVAFYRLVANHRFNAAAALWTPSLRSADPPPQYIDSRFSGVNGIAIRSLRLVAENPGAGTATVYVDLVETESNGATYHWSGTWQLVSSGSRWQLNSPQLSGGQVPTSPAGGGDEGD